MTRLPVVATAAVLLAVGFLVWFLGDDEPVAFDPPVVVATDDEPIDLRARARPTRHEAEPAGVPHLGFVDEESDLGPLLEPAEEGTLIRCLDFATGAPLPEIDVFVSDDDLVLPRVLALQISTGDLLRRFSRRYRTTADGSVRVPRAASGRLATVMSASRFGQVRYGRTQREATLLVQDLQGLLVRVVDEEGRPLAGIPVAWRHESAEGARSSRKLVLREFSRAPDGLLRLPLPGLEAQLDRRHLVVLDGIFAEEVAVAFDPRALPREPLEIVVPAHGEIEVQVRDAAGRPAADEGRELMAEALPSGGGDARVIGNGKTLVLQQVVAGRALIRPVALGLRLRLLLVGGVGEFEPVRRDLAGPTRAGERVVAVIELPPEPDRPVLVGRLFDAEGPLPETAFAAELDVWRGDTFLRSLSIAGRTDGEGRFRFGFHLAEEERGSEARIEFEIDRAFERRSRGRAGIRLLDLGRHELGDVVVRPDPFLVAGRVGDSAGRPLADVELVVEPDPEDQGEESSRRPPRIVGRSDAEGRFALHGPIATRDLVLSASASDFVAEERTIPRASRGLEIRLQRTATLSFRLTSEFATGEAAPVLVALGDGLGRDTAFTALPDGAPVTRSLRPGSYRLMIRDGSNARPPIFEQAGILLPEGETVDLGEIRLRGVRRKVRIHFVTEEGRRLDRLVIDARFHPEGRPEATESLQATTNFETLSFDVPSLPLRFAADVIGHGRVSALITEDEVDLEIVPGPLVRFRLPDIGELPAPARIELCLCPEGRRQHHFRPFPPDRGALELRLPRPGRYEVHWRVGAQLENRFYETRAVAEPAPSIIEPRDEGTAAQVIDLAPPRAALLAAFEELRADR